MNILFRLIELDRFKMLLRPLNVILIFLPLFFYGHISFIQNTYFWGIWVVASMILFYLQLNFLTRYRIVGQIRIDKDMIEIKRDNEAPLVFLVSDKLNIYIEYNGYKGERERYLNPMFMPFSAKEGVGRLEILKDNIKNKYDFLAEKDYYKKMVAVLNIYEQEGSKIDLRKD